MVVKRAVPISTLELQSRVEHADAMATRRSRSSLRDDSRMVVASRRRGGHGRDGRRFAATKRSRSSLRDDDIDDEVVMSWRSPLRGDETVAVVASRRDDGMPLAGWMKFVDLESRCGASWCQWRRFCVGAQNVRSLFVRVRGSRRSFRIVSLVR